MPEIKFDTGLVAYDINGACTVSFNPTDTNFVEKLFATFDQLTALQDEQEKDSRDTQEIKAFFEGSRKRDKDMRALVDGIFGTPVCDALFGSMNLYAMADGLPAWCNLVLAVMDEVDTTFAQEQKRTNSRLAKYTAKYKKK